MRRLLSGCLLLFASAPLWGAEVPKLQGPVNDYANVLSAEEQKKLTGFLIGQERKTTNQIVVLTVKSLDGDTIEGFAEKVFSTWKLGQKGKDNGVLIVLATAERKIRIEVGHGLEGALPDVIASRIIREEMAPKFKEKNFADGFMAAAVAIDKAIAGEFQAEGQPKGRDGGGGGWPLWLILLLIFGGGGLLVFFFFLAKYGDGGGGFSSGGGWSSGGWGSGGSSGGSSGSSSSGSSGESWGSSGSSDWGGGYSGGGGGSGGGGASGSY